MSEFLKVTGAPADVIGAATLINAAAESLSADLPGLLADIDKLETDAVLGNDQFAHNFTGSYRAPAATGSGSAATHDAANFVPKEASQHGSSVISAMQEYLVTDGRGAADIANTTAN